MKGKQRNKLPRTRAPITVKEARSSPRALAPKTVKVARSPNLDKSPPSSWPQQTFRHTTPRLLTLPPRLQFRHLTCRSRRRAIIRWLGNARHCAASDVVNEASQSCRNSSLIAPVLLKCKSVTDSSFLCLDRRHCLSAKSTLPISITELWRIFATGRKEVPCFENLQIAYWLENYYRNIPGYGC